MATFSKFVRPEQIRPGQITDRDLDILDAVLRYRFVSAAQLVRLVGGNEDVTHRRLRMLWEKQQVNRWAFPGIRTHSEFYYYIDNRAALDLLAEMRGLELHPTMLLEVRNNREKDYSGAALRGQHMQLGFLNHALMVSRMHFVLEMTSRSSGGQVKLESWSQGAQLAGRKVSVPKVKYVAEGQQAFWQEADDVEKLPVEPDALFSLRFPARQPDEQLSHFVYEADRGTMTSTDMLRKLRAYYHSIKKQQRHKEDFGIHPVRAVLIETTNEVRGKSLMSLVNHPLVAGPAKRAGLFWFTISSLFEEEAALPSGRRIPAYLDQPTIVFEEIWATPDLSKHSLKDAENN